MIDPGESGTKVRATRTILWQIWHAAAREVFQNRDDRLASAWFQAAHDALKDGEFPRERGLSLAWRAFVESRRGNPDVAEKIAVTALDLLAKSHDPNSQEARARAWQVIALGTGETQALSIRRESAIKAIQYYRQKERPAEAAELLLQLGLTAARVGATQEAVAVLRELLSEENTAPERHPARRAEMLSLLSRILGEASRLREAGELYEPWRREVQSRPIPFSHDDEQVLWFAELMCRLGRYEESVKLARQVFSGSPNGAENKLRSRALVCLAHLEFEAGTFPGLKERLRLLEERQGGITGTLSQEEDAKWLWLRGWTAWLEGRTIEAQKAWRDALDVLPPQIGIQFAVTSDLAESRALTEDPGPIAEEQRRRIEDCSDSLSQIHLGMAQLLRAYAVGLALDYKTECTPIAQRALRIAEGVLGSKHPHLVRYFCVLAECHWVNGNPANGRAICEAAANMNSTGASGIWDEARRQATLGRCLHLEGDRNAAWSAYWTAKSQTERFAWPEGGPHLIGGLLELDLATLSAVLMGPNDAEIHFRQAIQILHDRHKLEQQRILFEIARRAAVYLANEQYPEAVWLYESAHSYSKRTLGDSHPNTKKAGELLKRARLHQ